ncbi:hypothetical protein F5Y15DRAFT_12993 [Xylariaceae sp. FL0016]|nr:hypothetical protein F5Y15DRAFT_12993 [Xylariaceae sp. FL0016]
MSATMTKASRATRRGPSPTRPPITSPKIRDRAPNLCGYYDGLEDFPYVCAGGDACISDDMNSVVGCVAASGDHDGTDSVITTCIGYGRAAASEGPRVGFCESACAWYTYSGAQVDGYSIAICQDSEENTAAMVWEATATAQAASRTSDAFDILDALIQSDRGNLVDIDADGDVHHLDAGSDSTTTHSNTYVGIGSNSQTTSISDDSASANIISHVGIGSGVKDVNINNDVDSVSGNVDIDNNVDNAEGGVNIANDVGNDAASDSGSDAHAGTDNSAGNDGGTTHISNIVNGKSTRNSANLDANVTSVLSTSRDLVTSAAPPSATTAVLTNTASASGHHHSGALSTSDLITLSTALGVGLPATVAGIIATWITIKAWRRRKRQAILCDERALDESTVVKETPTADSEASWEEGNVKDFEH